MANKTAEKIPAVKRQYKHIKNVIKTPQTRVLFQRTLSRLRMGVFAAFLAVGVSLSVASLVIDRPAQAATTASTLNFQARLLNNSGSIVADGKYNVEFKLYNQASGGSALWTETYYDANGAAAGSDNRVTVRAGYLSVYLGSLNDFPPTINWDQELYLTMNIGGTAQAATPTYDGEMNPRLKLTAVPYAFKAGQLAQLNEATGFTSTLKLAQPTVGNQDFIVPDQGAAGTFTLLTTAAANAAYIQSQNSLQQANGQFWISGSGRADTSFLTPAVDTATAGILSIGVENATAINIGSTGVDTTINGALVVTEDATFNGNVVIADDMTLTVGTGATTLGGTLTVNGTQFTNAGATLNTAKALGNQATGTITDGVAANLVDIHTAFTINQATNSQVLSLPAPTDTTAGRIVYISNVGTASFTMHSTVVAAGGNATFLWNGTMWRTIVDSGISAVGTIDSHPTKSLDGAVVIGSGLYLQTADANFPGLVSTGAQTFAGAKTFVGGVLFQPGTDSRFALRATTASGNGLMRIDTVSQKIAFGAYPTADADNLSGQVQILPVHSGRVGLNIKGTVGYGANFIEAVDSNNNNIFRLQASGNIQTASGVFTSNSQSAASTDSSSASFKSGDVSGSGSTSGIATFGSGNSTTSGDTGAVTLKSGSATSGNSGSVTIDAGAASGTAGQIYIGTANASQVNIARTGVLTSIGGNLTVNGTQFTNNGATLNTVLALGNQSTGVINGGNATTSVDVKTAITINQTVQDQVLSLPAPTNTAAGRIIYVSNIGTESFTMHSIVVNAGSNAFFIWNGTAWKPAIDSGVSSIGILNEDELTKSVNGAVIVGSSLYLQTADASHAGLVGTGTQTFAGDKTFNGVVTLAAPGTGLEVTNSATIGGNLSVTNGATTLTGSSAGSVAALTVSTGAASNRGVVIEGVALQSANLFHVSVAGVTDPVATIGSTGAVNFRNSANSTQAFNIETAGGGNLFTVDTVNSRIGINLGADNLPASTLEINGTLRLSGTGTESFVTPGGINVPTKINIPIFNPGNNGQILAFGLPSNAETSSRAISIFDGRTTAHQPSLAVFSPDENSIIGFSWNGTNTLAAVQTNGLTFTDPGINGNSKNIVVQSGNVSGGNVTSSGDTLINTGSISGGVSGTTGTIYIVSGNANNTNSSSGNVVIDSGSKSGSGTTGVINLGVTNASAVNISKTGVATTVNGTLTVEEDTTFNGNVAITGTNTLTVGTGAVDFGGTLTVAGNTILNGSQLTNNGSTLNTAKALGNQTTGSITDGTTPNLVDVHTAFTISQTTGSQTLSLPAPTTTTAGRIVYVSNIGTASFTMHSVIIAAGSNASFIWNGTAWKASIDSGISAVGALDSQPTKSLDGAQVVGSALYLQTADEDYAGLVSTIAQTFAGDKTFLGQGIFDASGSGLSVTNDASIGGTLGVTGSATIGGTLGVTGNATIGGNLSVTGSISGNGVNSGTGLLQGTGGLTITGTTNINATGSAATSIGNTGAAFSLQSTGLNISATGALTGVSGINTSGGYTQTGTSTNQFTGVTTFSAAGTALQVTNNATVGGTLAVGNGVVAGTQFSATSTSAGQVTAAFRGATSQTADLLQLQNGNNEVLASFSNTGQLTLGRISSTGLAQAGMLTFADGTNSGFGATITSANLTADRRFLLPDSILATTASPATVCVFNGLDSNCPATSGSEFYIQNRTTVQTNTNFAIRSVSPTSVTGVLEGTVGQTADILNLNSFNGTTSTIVARFTAAGNLQVANSIDTTTATTLSIGTTNANAVTIASTGVATTVKGILDVEGYTTLNGFTNNGATVNTVLALNNQSTGVINGGNAATSVDVKTAITINQTVTDQILTLPTPTNTAPGRIIYVSNIGTQSFTLNNQIIAAGSNASFLWNGSAWRATIDSGISAIGTIDSQTKSDDGAVVVGSGLYLQTADEDDPGLVSTDAQTFAGAKTFNGQGTFAASGTGLQVTNNATIGGTLGVTGSVSANSLTLTNALTVTNGGTGATSFTNNGLLYGNGTGALQVTAAGTAGQVLIANASGVPTFVSFSGDITVSATGATTIQTDSVALGTDTTGSYIASIGSLTGLSATGGSGEGSTLGLSVLYGAAANTAVQGNTTLTCASGTGNLTGGGTSITLGNGGACGAISTVDNPTFATSVTTPSLQSSTGLSIGSGSGAVTINTTNTANTSIGNGTGALTLTGSNGSTFVLGGVTVDATEFNRLDGHDAALIDVNDAVTTAITGTGTLTSGALGAGFTTVGVAQGGTGATSFTTNGVVYGNSTGALQVTAAGTAGQVLMANASGVPTFVTFTGDVTVATTGATTIQANSVDLGTDTTGNYVSGLTAGAGVSITGTAGEGWSPSVAVLYGSTANTAVQGSTTLTCASGTGNLTGGGTTITLGNGGSCAAINTVNNPTFSTSVTTPSLQSDTNLSITSGGTGTVAINTTNTLSTGIGNSTGSLTLTGGSSSTFVLGGTTIDATEFNRLDGHDAALIDVNDAVTTAITGTGTLTSGALGAGFATVGVAQGGTGATSFTTNGVVYGNSTGALQVTTAGTAGQVLMANASGVPTFTTFTGDITVSAGGVTTIQANSVALGTDTTGNYVSGLIAGNGVSITGTAGEGWSPSVAVLYGSSANTAVQGSTTLTCASGTGNLAGGGTTITLGSGGACAAINTVNNPTFSTSVTTPLLRSTGAMDITPGGALTVGAASQTFTLQGAASSTITATSGSFTTTVGFVAPTAARSILFPNAGGTICTDVATTCSSTYAPASGSGNYIQNQNVGAQASSNFWISGTGRADTSFLTPRIDTASGTTLVIGNTNATDVEIGQLNVPTTVKGGLTVVQGASVQGALGVTGATTLSSTLSVGGAASFSSTLSVSGATTLNGVTNNGSTLNTAFDLGTFASGGSIGANTATVDSKTTFTMGVSTTNQTFTLPTPTITTAGRIVYISNTGSNAFTMHGQLIAPGSNSAFIWNGSAWKSVVDSGVTTIGGLDSQSPKSANGAIVVGNGLYLQTADEDFAGLVSTGTQTFAGDKTFNGAVTLAASGTALHVNNNATVDGTLSTGGNATIGGTLGVTGSITGNGVSAGSGLLQGTGGLTITGTTQINTTGAASTTIGNTGAAFSLQSTGLNISTAGALTGVTGIATSGGYTQSGTGTNTFTGVTEFEAAGDAITVVNNISTGTINNLSLTRAVDGFTIAGGSTTSRTLTVTGADITIGNVIRPTNPGELAVVSSGAHELSFETGGAAAINIGLSAANAINIGRTNMPTNVKGTLTVTQLLTGQTGATIGGGAIALTGNANSSFTTTNGGVLTLTSAAGATWSTTAGNLTLQAGSGTVSLGTSTTLTANGALTVTSGGATTMTVDAGGATTLNLGTANANAVSISRTGMTTTVEGALTVDENARFNGQVGIGAAPTRPLQVSVNNTATTGLPVLIEQNGTGDTGLEFKNPNQSYYVGVDTSDNNTFKISSTTSASTNVQMGNTAVGSLLDGSNSNNINYTQFTVPSTGTISTLVAYVGPVDNAPNNKAQMAVYADNSGNPGSRLTNSSDTTLSGNSWNTFSVTPINVTAGQVIWLAYNTNGTNTNVNNLRYTTGGVARFQSRTYTLGWPATASGLSSTTQLFSVYAMIATGTSDNLSKGLFQLTAAGRATFQNSVDTAAALQVQNAAGNNIFTVDTSNSQIVLGKSNSINGRLTFQNATNTNTATIVSGVTSSSYTLTLPATLGGVGQCLVDTSGTGTLGFTSCVTTTVTLQSSYNNSTATSPEIKLDGVHGGLDIQDSDAGLTNHNFIALRGSNASGLGNIRFSVNTNGNLYMKPATDSSSLIEIRRANDAGLFVLDSTTGRLGLGLGSTGASPNLPSFTLDVGGTINTSTSILAPTHDTSASVTMNVGTSNATAVDIAKTGVATTVKGSLTVEQASTFKGNVEIQNASTLTVGTGLTQLGGNLTVAGTVQLNGTQVTNVGATVNTVLQLPDQPAGAINSGNAGATVNSKTAIAIAQSTPLLTLSLPNPSPATAGRIVYIINNGTADFTMHGVIVRAGNNAGFIWNGSAWRPVIEGGVTNVGTFSSSPLSNGASISGSTIIFGPADATNPGMISTDAQTFTGAKTFNGQGTFAASGTGLQVTNNATVGGTLSVTGSISGNGVNSGTGLIQGTGGLTVRGAVSINTTGSASTDIGSGSGTFSLQSSGLDVATNGDISTTGGYTQTGSTANTFTGVTSFAAANGISLGTSNTATGGIVFRGAGGFGTLTLVGPTTPNAGNYTLSIPAITGNQTICVSGTVCAGYQAAPASGAFLMQVPTTTEDNTISPTAAGVIGLTVNGTTAVGGAPVAMSVNQSGAGDGMSIRLMNTSGSQSSALSISRSSVGSTAVTSSLLDISNPSNNGTVTNAINISGTYATNLINSPTFKVTNAGAVTAVGVNSGTGLIQGTGGLTVTGAVNINTTVTANTSIGNGLGSFSLQSVGLDVTSTGDISTPGTYTQTGTGGLNTFTGMTDFTAAGNALRVTNNISTGTINNLTLTSSPAGAADGFSIAGGSSSRTLTVSGANITIGNIIQPTAAGPLTIQSNGTNNMTVDAGAILKLGTTNASSVEISKLNASTSVLGAFTVDQLATFNGNIQQNNATDFSTGTGTVSLRGATTVTGTNTFRVNSGATTLGGTLQVDGTQFTNAGATLNTALVLPTFGSNGPIGAAVDTVDKKTAFIITQDATVSLTIPSPTVNTPGRIIYISNKGIAPFDVNGNTIPINATFSFMWNGTQWTYTGATAGVNNVGAFISSGGSALNGASISGSTITFQAANASAPGMVSTIGQTFMGPKTFASLITGQAGITVSGGSIQLTGNTGSTIATSVGALTITSAEAANWTTSTGDLTIQAGSGIVNLGSSTNLRAAGALNIRSGGTSNLSVDTSNSSAALNLGTTFAGTINMGASGILTKNFGNMTVDGDTTVGFGGITTFTNKGSTLNTALDLSNVPTGNLASAAQISGYTMFNVDQNIADQSLSVPNPTVNTPGRIIYISNKGNQSFTISSVNLGVITFGPNATIGLIWNGNTWTSIGAGTIGTLDSRSTPSLNGATFVGNVLYLQSASKTAPGLVNTIGQTFAGLKTFSSGAIVSTTASATVPVFQVQNAGGAASLTIDTRQGTATNIANNGDAEGSGGWETHVTTGSPVALTPTGISGEFASGLAGIKVTTTSTTTGVRNKPGALSAGTYLVSFSVKASSTLGSSSLAVQYYRDATNLEATCASNQADSITSAGFVKYTCSFTVTNSGIAAQAYVAIHQTDGAAGRIIYVDNLSIVAQGATSDASKSSRLIVGGDVSQGLTLFTLDKSAGPPQAVGSSSLNPSLFGSMYFDTTIGRIQCYESSGWGSCGNSPDVSVNLIPEYTGAVLNGKGIGTMTADMCSDPLNINDGSSSQPTLCGVGESYNFYKWTSPQTASPQTYSIYIRYQLPATFKNFADDNTITLTARTTDTANGKVNFSLYGPTGTQCGSTTDIVASGTPTPNQVNTWYTTRLGGTGETNCAFQANDIVMFKIDVTAQSNASVYVSNLSFLTKGK